MARRLLSTKKLLKAIEAADFRHFLTKSELRAWERFLDEAVAEGREKLVLRLTHRGWRAKLYLWAVWSVHERGGDGTHWVLEGLFIPREEPWLGTPEELAGERFFPA
jgi:hypothetical protein